MKIYRPLWSEGVLLAPQQFQQQSEWESFSRAGLSTLIGAFSWGVERIEFNEALLTSGRIQVQTLRLWLPDGTLIDTQSSDLPPEPREVTLPASDRADSVTVLVALPVMQPGIVNVQTETVPAERPLRYREEWVTIQDAFGQEEEPMAVARFNLAFRLIMKVTMPGRLVLWHACCEIIRAAGVWILTLCLRWQCSQQARYCANVWCCSTASYAPVVCA
ncbi:Uncharacterized protein conserved in bacteria [Raoultella terrigena]|uniref:Uncharacterized protein conserved in bacteria n=1 Tax=Raoultella terrigena TaxID=577 RepID=A0A3P8KJG1_RAOTE|nr:Uncharacterized protein conserved in bacteria [Raoultella terrigena]